MSSRKDRAEDIEKDRQESLRRLEAAEERQVQFERAGRVHLRVLKDLTVEGKEEHLKEISDLSGDSGQIDLDSTGIPIGYQRGDVYYNVTLTPVEHGEEGS